MYKDNGTVDEIDDDDVQLIADVGFIASRVRLLERTFFGGYFDTSGKSCCHHHHHHHQQQRQQQQLGEIEILTKSDCIERNFHNSLGTTIQCQKDNGISDSDNYSNNNNNNNNSNRQRLLEDLLIKFYEDHERVKLQQKHKQQQQQQQVQQQEEENFEAKTGNIMNKSAETINKASSTIAATSTNLTNNDDNEAIESTTATTTTTTATASTTTTTTTTTKTGNLNKFLEKQSTISTNKLNLCSNISDINNDKVVTSRSEGNIENSYNQKQKINDLKTIKSNDVRYYTTIASGSSVESGIAKTSSTILSSSGNCENVILSTSNNKNEFKLIRLENTLAQCSFNDDDLRALVKELRRKVEYTEKMNWLCLAKRQTGQPIRKSSLPKHQEVKKHFLEICENTFSDEVKAALRLPAFDSYEWNDADVIHLMQTMFIELGLIEKFNIPIVTLREWLYEVYKHYNEVPFHNFRHCFCVAQMMYAISRQANLIARLGDLEVLILLVSCICHDLDHPGYNNIYQINARTELALRYNDISPLENHHCSIAFRLLEHPDCNIFKNFNRETFNFIREGIIRCILATDMARHNEILTQFKEIVPVFDYSNRAHVNLLCMILIKVADISNEARPMDVAEPWLDRLLQEFFAQSAAEKSEGLPVTPFMDPEKVSKPGSQVRFIGLVLLPLFEALGELIPELTDLIIVPVRVALDYYKRLNDAQNKTRKSLVETTENSSDGGGSGSPQLPRSQSGISVRSRRSIPSQKSTSRNSVDEPTCVAAELHDLPEGSESGDSETATEVDVAEKTSKFKVDTESANRSKSSHSASRKSSREKRPSMISELCSSGGRIRNSYGNIHGYHPNRCHFGSNRAVSLDQYSSNNRRSSDGLQQVTSDSNVFYNRHNRSMDNDGQSTMFHGVIGGEKVKITEANTSEDLINSNYDSSGHKQIIRQVNIRNNSNGSHASNGNHSQNGAKSWKARFKQITEYFSFGIEKTNKRFHSARSSPCSLRNNNAEIMKQQGICCTITNNLSPSLKKKQDLTNAGRNRALSLDVPARQRYSSSSGGDSRKSSKNEDNSNRHDLLNEDDNSNNTSSGDVPSSRIRGGSDGTDQVAMSLPKVITPSMEMEHFNMDNSLISGCAEIDSSAGGGGGGGNDGGPKI